MALQDQLHFELRQREEKRGGEGMGGEGRGEARREQDSTVPFKDMLPLAYEASTMRLAS